MNDFTTFFPLVLPITVFVLAVFAIIVLILVWAFSRKLKPKQEYGVRSITQRGEPVRSIAEQRRNSRYYYYDITLPDFYLPEYNVYVEYWGLVDADDELTRTRYARNMRKKMAIYHKNNIKFISIYPRNLENLDWIFRAKFRKATGYELPKSSN